MRRKAPSEVSARRTSRPWAAARPGRAGEAGFTLIESLVALALIAAGLSAIGGLAASNVRSAQQVNQRLAMVSTLRKIETALPDRGAFESPLTGEMAGQSFSIAAAPYPDPSPPPAGKGPPAWTAQSLVIRVENPTGATIELETVRLVPVTAP